MVFRMVRRVVPLPTPSLAPPPCSGPGSQRPPETAAPSLAGRPPTAGVSQVTPAILSEPHPPLRVPETADYTYSSVPRRCGGSHTLTYPYRRNRLQHPSQGLYPTEEVQIAMKVGGAACSEERGP